MNMRDILLARALGGGSGGVTSWNDLQDKPFGEEEVIVLPETEAINTDESIFVIMSPIEGITTGGTYTVKYNGASYGCVGQTFDMDGVPLVALGNVGAMFGGVDTGEPFVMMIVPSEIVAQLGAGATIMSLDGATSVTIAINGETIKTLDEKYLPNLTSPSGKKFKLSVDDNGTISATEV